MIPRVILSLCFILATSAAVAPQAGSDGSQLFGDWIGESKCAGINLSCHDEIVVYHISRSKSDPAKITIAADKIVNGKPDPMGDIDCSYDREKQTLTSEFKIPRTGGRGVFLFTIKGDVMEGTLTVYPENEIGRKIKVRKKKSTDK